MSDLTLAAAIEDLLVNTLADRVWAKVEGKVVERIGQQVLLHLQDMIVYKVNETVPEAIAKVLESKEFAQAVVAVGELEKWVAERDVERLISDHVDMDEYVTKNELQRAYLTIDF